MTDRINKINEIVFRELNSVLHKNFRDESLFFVISYVSVAPDLNHAKIFYSAPDAEQKKCAQRFFRKHNSELRMILAKKIPIHHFPELHFICDKQLDRELRVCEILDELDREDRQRDA